MWKNQRHQRIFRRLEELQSVTTDDLVEDLSVSRETVRRDLLDMEALGLLRRVHGGAVSADAHSEPPLHVRSSLHVKEKQSIARAACDLITDHKVIFFDTGSTTISLARQLATIHGLHVISNSLEAASRLQKDFDANRISSRVTLLGGSLTAFDFATAGQQTLRQISRIQADIAFVSPTAIDPEHGAVNAAESEAEVALAMLENSRESVVLADAAKFSTSGNYRYCRFEQMDALVTDAQIRKQADLVQSVTERVKRLIIAA
ncbi:DeoR/GlpR transcriptional regulator [Parasedimentitalea marina]|uniref:DeoR/GlpR transcriptional regulator n=1 Tax=Parasedimentitalea marina TaxID=2483033 RepID=A0A3T0N014_9RHOB|nr:DeoR/GlpR family DNA-binding transcription regulator [Parasedimentitalea marina]AZV77363.1 DeoR/GlpR transcriptional regulator [Parasedimentitalea marina]